MRRLHALAWRMAARLAKWAFRHGWFRSRTWSFGPVSSEDADVLMCLWNRKERLVDMLQFLDAQTGVSGVRLYLWNNQRRDDRYYREVLERFEAAGALREVRYVRSPLNLGAMARFYWARRIAKSRGSHPIIVIDDDEDIRIDFVQRSLAAYDPKAISAFWAFVIHGPTYWDRDFATVGGHVDHIGPGGIVVDAAVFLDQRFFTELPERFWLLDDIWLTNFARRVGLDLRKLDVEIDFVLDETNQYWSQLDLKVEFHRHLYGEPAG